MPWRERIPWYGSNSCASGRNYASDCKSPHAPYPVSGGRRREKVRACTVLDTGVWGNYRKPGWGVGEFPQSRLLATI